MSQNTHIINVKTRGADKSKKKVKGVSGALAGLAKKAGIAAAYRFFCKRGRSYKSCYCSNYGFGCCKGF